MSTIKSRPILFSGEMVRALLAGRKSQTRRAVKPQPHPRISERFPYPITRGQNLFFCESPDNQYPMWEHHIACPYGQPGDLLWVRETWGKGATRVMYRAGCNHVYRPPEGWKPSIHMPRWASRLTLEITGVRVERLHDISEADARAEGVSFGSITNPATGEIDRDATEAFEALWSGINGAESWESNPWVWVIEFKTHHCNVDELIKQREAA